MHMSYIIRVHCVFCIILLHLEPVVSKPLSDQNTIPSTSCNRKWGRYTGVAPQGNLGLHLVRHREGPTAEVALQDKKKAEYSGCCCHRDEEEEEEEEEEVEE